MGKFYYDKKGYPRWRDSGKLVHRSVSKPAPGEVVHHIDGNIHNFRRENLENMSRSEHSRLHADKRKNSMAIYKDYNNDFWPTPRNGRVYDRIFPQRNEVNDSEGLFVKVLMVGVALYAVYWILNQIWQLIVFPIILFIISIKYYVILGIYFIGFIMVTLYLEKKNLLQRPYSFLGGIISATILAISIMAVFGLI